MAIHTTITAAAPFEEQRETLMSRAFVQILQAQANFILAERDLEDVGHSQDPAYDHWLHNAECAQEELTTSLRHFRQLSIEVPEDRPLQRMVLMIDTMLGNEEPRGARQLHREMQLRFFSHLQARGIGATAMQRNAMLILARHLTTEMIALPIFDSADVADEVPDPDTSPAF